MKLFAKPAAAALALVLAALAAASCGTNGAARNGAAAEAAGHIDFSVVRNADWILTELRRDSRTVTLDRAFHAEAFGDIFAIRFQDAMVSGRGMPNSFRGPYTLGDGQSITFGPMATTMMAAFMEPDELVEHEFFLYLYNAFMWDVYEGNLELHTTDEAGAVVVLVFAGFVPAGE